MAHSEPPFAILDEDAIAAAERHSDPYQPVDEVVRVGLAVFCLQRRDRRWRWDGNGIGRMC